MVLPGVALLTLNPPVVRSSTKGSSQMTWAPPTGCCTTCAVAIWRSAAPGIAAESTWLPPDRAESVRAANSPVLPRAQTSAPMTDSEMRHLRRTPEVRRTPTEVAIRVAPHYCQAASPAPWRRHTQRLVSLFRCQLGDRTFRFPRRIGMRQTSGDSGCPGRGAIPLGLIVEPAHVRPVTVLSPRLVT